jgi:hypothetical protein
MAEFEPLIQQRVNGTYSERTRSRGGGWVGQRESWTRSGIASPRAQGARWKKKMRAGVGTVFRIAQESGKVGSERLVALKLSEPLFARCGIRMAKALLLNRELGKIIFHLHSSALGHSTFGLIFSETCKVKAVEQVNQRRISYEFPAPTMLSVSKLPADEVIARDTAIVSFTAVKASRTF